MMQVLITIALKSLLIAGITLGLLELMKRRSAAERSSVAHIGLLALVIMAFAPLVLPTWNVEAPALLGKAPVAEAAVRTSEAGVGNPLNVQGSTMGHPSASLSGPPPRSGEELMSPVAATTAAYALPATILLFITFLALARLIALRARAEVLVDGHWLSALARAQRRMGFKHGTALLTSNELSSPISWGLLRPVILLNTRAVEASGEAEAIIAHELAHVARMDWAKLLLARVATALFWFNPLVWLLAREAHQLREEAADDAVLAADIADTDYAQLLVGVARHECPGLLLGAHGVAPSKSSLARRVARVLDGKSVRGPVARSFALGVFVGAVLIAAPLAALTLTPGGSAKQNEAAARTLAKAAPASAYAVADPVPTDLPHIIAKGVSTSVASAVAAIQPGSVAVDGDDFSAVGPTGATVTRGHGITVARGSNGATATIYPPDAQGRSRIVARSANGAVAVAYADADEVAAMAGANDARRERKSAIDRAIELKAVGATPQYLASLRAVAPQINLSHDEIVQLAGLGVTAQFIQALASAGYRGVSANQISEAYAVGVRPDYIRGMAAAGYRRLPLHQLAELKAVGITPADVERFRRAGYTHLDVNEMVEAKSLGLSPEELRASDRNGRRPSRKGRPAASPPDWETPGDG